MTTWERTMEALVLADEAADDVTLRDIIEFQLMEEDEKCTVESSQKTERTSRRSPSPLSRLESF